LLLAWLGDSYYYAYPVARFVTIFGTFYANVGFTYVMEMMYPKSRGTMALIADTTASGIDAVF